jgi:hypothetical protein
MKSSNSLTNLIAFLIWLFVVLGCGGGKSTYFSIEKWGCLTPDGSRIGIANRDTTVVIDAHSGQLLKSEKTEHEGGVVCLSNNKVIAVYPEVAIDLTGTERMQRNDRTFTIIGASGYDGIVHYSGGRPSSSKSSFASPFQVYFEKFGVVDNPPKLLEVPFERFKGLTPNTSSYLIIPVRVLDDGKLLVVAGNRPGYSMGTGRKTTVTPSPWGFFTIVPRTGEVENYGSIKTQDSEINFINVPKTYSTPDGKFLALTSRAGESITFAVWSAAMDKEIFRQSVPDTSELSDIIVSNDGTRVAILGKFQNKLRIRIYDIAGKSKLSEFTFSESTTQFLGLTNDELTLSDYYGLVSKINIQTGQKIWEWRFPSSK